MKAIAYIALGSNLDNPKMQIQDAFAELDEIENTRLLQTSSLYASAPWGYADQPDFVNAVASVETELSPQRLLEELLKIEAWHGRSRTFANAPRTLDGVPREDDPLRRRRRVDRTRAPRPAPHTERGRAAGAGLGLRVLRVCGEVGGGLGPCHPPGRPKAPA